MPSPCITTRNVSKRYLLGQRSHGTLRDLLFGGRRGKEPPTRDVWALRDVSFDVFPGEVVGIVGRNGSGKSTLLKIISRVTEPTSGAVHVIGRLGSLLEVGTGFHPELTGRENLFLNGAMLGMKRREIARKFDQIVDFAGVEPFLDTPVKHYSSGMYMRLAFSVAVHLDPEILIVDEVLAVGDASFQRRCLSKMESVSGEGRTVLFVSHNMPAITRLCPRALLLDAGVLVADGPSHEIAARYLGGDGAAATTRRWSLETAPGNHVVKLLGVEARVNGQTIAALDIRNPLSFSLEFQVLEGGHVLCPNVQLYTDDGVCAFITNDMRPSLVGEQRSSGRYRAEVTIPGNFLAEGIYFVGVAINTFSPFTAHVLERDCLGVHVVDTTDGDSARGNYTGPIPGVVRPLLPWATSRLEALDA